VGKRGISVKAINLFMYTRLIMQHSGLKLPLIKLTKIKRNRKVLSQNLVFTLLLVFLVAKLFFKDQTLQVFLKCTFPQKRKTIHFQAWSACPKLNPKVWFINITSIIYECSIVATAPIIDSTFGLEIVVDINMLFTVDDFRFSFSS
jgi:hypothetical protein